MKKFIDSRAKLDNELSNYKKSCRCGHTQVVTGGFKGEYVLCTHCGGRLYKDDEKQKEYENKRDNEEFRYKLSNMLKRGSVINAK